MINTNFFTHNYNLEELITYFALQNNNIYYLDTSTGEISIQKTENSFAFKPLQEDYVLANVDISSKNLSYIQILESNNKDKRVLYNFIKDNALNFLAENKILPPSLHPIIGFKQPKEDKNKIIIEIN